ncbi:hypothetical protein Tco_1045802 [Tanacetum coccineum]|uniref:Uncharacterized protein n=1 Tax=Tanacetum coccineum TaxID=301880 RepID=A0ABQ5GVQ5_9ASTR
MDDLDNGNLDVYERKVCYDECEKIYVEALIFINKRLVRLIDVTVEQWLDLIYDDHTMIYWTRGDDEEVITDNELSNPGDGNFIEETEIVEIFRIETDIFHSKHLYRFDEHDLMGDEDDDIDDLEDYLIQKDPPYYVNKEEERSKERRCKLLGIPYVKPPTCKSEKFEVVKYSFRPAEEHVAIKKYEYEIRV